jgi:hypothetical protein
MFKLILENLRVWDIEADTGVSEWEEQTILTKSTLREAGGRRRFLKVPPISVIRSLGRENDGMPNLAGPFVCEVLGNLHHHPLEHEPLVPLEDETQTSSLRRKLPRISQKDGRVLARDLGAHVCDQGLDCVLQRREYLGGDEGGVP